LCLTGIEVGCDADEPSLDRMETLLPATRLRNWRVIGVPPRDLSANSQLTFEELEPTLLEVGARGLSFTSCHWFANYKIHHRFVERFRDRRCWPTLAAAGISRSRPSSAHE
jgi:hypothetical protein